MSDLHGEDAFAAVLDRLVDAEKRVAVLEERERNDNSREKIGRLERELNNARSDITTLKTERDTALPRLAELWVAAREVSTRCKNNVGIEDIVAERLAFALASAGDYCDQIPF